MCRRGLTLSCPGWRSDRQPGQGLRQTLSEPSDVSPDWSEKPALFSFNSLAGRAPRGKDAPPLFGEEGEHRHFTDFPITSPLTARFRSPAQLMANSVLEDLLHDWRALA